MYSQCILEGEAEDLPIMGGSRLVDPQQKPKLESRNFAAELPATS